MILEKNSKGQIIKGTSETEPTKHLSPVNYIGIDPDVDKYGFAVYNKKLKKLQECTSIIFFDVMRRILEYDKMFMKDGTTYVVMIEGGWLSNNNNWHSNKKDTGFRKRQRIAKNVGGNHQSGLKIVEMCIEFDFPFQVVKPKAAVFAFTPYFQKVTGWQGKTNADARSAARYVYGF